MGQVSDLPNLIKWQVGDLPHKCMSMLSQITSLVKDPPPSYVFELSEAGIAYTRQKLEETTRVRALVKEALSQFGDSVEIPDSRGAFYFLIRPRTKMEPISRERSDTSLGEPP